MDTLKRTTIPLSSEVLKDFVLNRNNKEIDRTPKFIVNYKNSDLRKEHFVNYMVNLKLCVEIEEAEEDFEYMLSKYLTLQVAVPILNFNREMASLLMYDANGMMLEGSFFSTKEAKDSFIKANKESFDKWKDFLWSLPYTIPFFFNFYKPTGEKLIESKEVEVMDTQVAVGINVLNLFYLDGFIENYIALVSSPKKRYYRHMLSQRCFEGKNLTDVLSTRTSFLPFLNSFIKTEHEPEHTPNVSL